MTIKHLHRTPIHHEVDRKRQSRVAYLFNSRQRIGEAPCRLHVALTSTSWTYYRFQQWKCALVLRVIDCLEACCLLIMTRRANDTTSLVMTSACQK